MDTNLTYSELDSEMAALLPSKETLSWHYNWSNFYASNSSMAINAATLLSQANSAAVQTITFRQG